MLIIQLGDCFIAADCGGGTVVSALGPCGSYRVLS
jgi:hypothetical protein